jgi:DNA-binding transcriptional LysR family regulator
VSRQLAALEDECGGQLFHRNGCGLLATTLGESILPQIDLILSTTKRLSESKANKRIDAVEEVRVATSPAVGLHLLERLFKTLRQSHPRIRLHVTESFSWDIQASLEDSSIDVGVMLREGRSLTRADRIVCEFDTYLVGPSDDPLLQQDEIAFTALDGLPLLLPDRASLCRRAIDAEASAKGIKLSVVANANALGPTMCLLRARAGYLVTPIWAAAREPMSMVDAELRAQHFRAVKIVKPRFARTLVVRSAFNPSPGVNAVVQQTLNVLHAFKGD